MNDRPDTLTLGNFTWHVNSRRLERIHREESEQPLQDVTLTYKQFRLLKCLFDAYPNVLEREKIVDYVWESKPTSTESLPQLINRTRQTLEDIEKCILVNEPGVGYSLSFTLELEPVPDTQCEVTLKPRYDQNINGLDEQKSGSKNILWRTIFLVAFALSVINVWHAAEAIYYHSDFKRVLQAKPYPHTTPLDGDKILVKIDGHECTYEKSKLLLKCS